MSLNHYYVNNKAQDTGEHEIHKKGCDFFPGDNTYLGYFTDCQGATEKAEKLYADVDGCLFCNEECHSG